MFWQHKYSVTVWKEKKKYTLYLVDSFNMLAFLFHCYWLDLWISRKYSAQERGFTCWALSLLIRCLHLNSCCLCCVFRDLVMKTLTQVTTAPAFKPWELADVQKHLSLDLATLKTRPNVCQYTKHTVPGCVLGGGGGAESKSRIGDCLCGLQV